MVYVDAFLLPVKKSNLAAYQRIARVGCKVWLKYGALAYYECVGDDLNIPGMLSPLQAAGAKKGETAAVAFVVYKSRKHRDQVNKQAMADKTLVAMCGKKMPFDCKRMFYGGYKSIAAGPK